MAVEITLFNFKKKKFSTAIPSKGDGDTWDCRINRTCSVISPELVFDFSGVEEAPPYNYAYIDSFNRWYFINNWTYNAGLWCASCSVDALATWWDDIKTSTQYVVRNANLYSGLISDSLYPTTAGVTYTRDSVSSPFKARSSLYGTYIIGIIGGNSRGCVSYYAMDYSNFKTFSQKLFDPDNFAGLEETVDSVTKFSFNPIQYIASCMYFPIYLGDITESNASDVSSISLGWWTLTGVTAYQITKADFIFKFSIDMPRHPQASQRGVYLNASPFSRYKLVARPFGEMVIDSSFFVNINTAFGEIHIDLYTGKALLFLMNGLVGTEEPFSFNEVLTSRAMVGVNIALAQSAIDTFSAFGNGVALANAFTDYNFTATVGNVLNFANSLIPQLSTVGSSGSMAEYVSTRFYIDGEFFMVTADSPENRGRPLCQEKVLSTLSGYTICDDVVVELPCTEDERTMIKSILEGGFYIE